MNLLRRLFGRRGRRQRQALPRTATFRPAVEPLETREVPTVTNIPNTATLTAAEVQQLLLRAASVDNHQDAIIAIVDRNGRILGVRVEGGVSPQLLSNPISRTFAIDGAVAEARTGAFFGNAQAPLTSRTIQFISQTTITRKEVNSNPDLNNPNLPGAGPGFVAPVGQGGHFPPRVAQTPPVDLFAIEHTNRDSLLHPNAQGIKVPGQNVLQMRFNIDPAFVPPGQALFAPESYGFVSGILPTAQARGIGTLPGGIPIYKLMDGSPQIVGGIGVFFPGKTGFASAENSSLSDTFNPHKPDRSLEAEFIATAAVGLLGHPGTLPNIGIPTAFLSQRIDLAGVTLDTIGPGGNQGLINLLKFGKSIHPGTPTGTDVAVDAAGDQYLNGLLVPEGWLVTPHDGVGGLTADMVRRIINQGIAAANATRAQIRLPIGVRTKMVFAVADKQGNILGLYRMNDATIFSIDVAVAKARNVSYYDDANALQPIDQVNGLMPGASLTNRTFRYLAQPRFPEGIDGTPPGPFSILNDHAKVAANFKSVLGHDAFFPGTNFRDQRDPIVNQNGIVFFPGSQGLYGAGGLGGLIGGLGVSGDGVDQDDFITTQGGIGFGPPPNLRADNFFVRGVRLPFNKFPRNPLD
jgi:uncharacterized protein GlcG (DUF336 family)